MTRRVNPFEIKGNWYKANFHTHTNNSDGGLPPEAVVANYRRKGYDVLALTDHNFVNVVDGLSTKDMLVISGVELHPPVRTQKGNLFHIVCLNVKPSFEFRKPYAYNVALDQIRQVKAAGGLSILAHPFWCGLEYADYKTFVDEVAAVEVFNTICNAGAGRGASENEWSYILDRGHRLPSVGVDDTHSGGRRGATDCFGGWTWLKMPSLTVANVLKALRTGACYSSTGPTIHDFRITEGKLALRCSPAAEIIFKGGPGQGERRQIAKGKTATTHSMPTPDHLPFVRAVVTDAQGRRAWTNPIWMKR